MDDSATMMLNGSVTARLMYWLALAGLEPNAFAN